MRPKVIAGIFLIAALGGSVPAGADPVPISAFAAERSITSVTISPDGRYIAKIGTAQGRHVAFVLDRSAGATAAWSPVLSDAPDSAQLVWCRWATATRLLCGYRGMVKDVQLVYAATRLVAIDCDGKHRRVLLENSTNATGQFQDQIIDWNPGVPDTVLIQADERQLDITSRVAMIEGSVSGGTSSGGYPAVFELNVVSGTTNLRIHSRPPIRVFMTDHHGNARLAWGLADTGKTYRYFVRLGDTREWTPLLKFDAFSSEAGKLLKPVAIDPEDATRAYAIGYADGRDALWSIDLTDKQPPRIIFSHPLVDVSDPVFAEDGRLLGVFYETDAPFLFYTDSQASAIVRGLKTVLPNRFIVLTGFSADRKLIIVRTTSDTDAGTYYLLEVDTGKLTALGTAYPQVNPDTLGRMKTISYPASDGTTIPGYLTVPPGVRAEGLPLIVMPHGGPIARDSWRYDFLQQFLVSRGYAVLQMNFRGSSGYGGDWLYAAHQDWGGLTYSDIVDGTRWAVKQGIADPKRVCIVGWSFGGYAALLGAARNADLFHCAVSIAGLSDLSLLLVREMDFVGSDVAREQIGTKTAKLRADSPRNHAADLNIPLLMLHGDFDAQSNIEQSEAMDAALRSAHKPHEFIEIKGADHQLSRESDRVTLLTSIEKFLAAHLGAGAAASQ